MPRACARTLPFLCFCQGAPRWRALARSGRAPVGRGQFGALGCKTSQPILQTALITYGTYLPLTYLLTYFAHSNVLSTLTSTPRRPFKLGNPSLMSCHFQLCLPRPCVFTLAVPSLPEPCWNPGVRPPDARSGSLGAFLLAASTPTPTPHRALCPHASLLSARAPLSLFLPLLTLLRSLRSRRWCSRLSMARLPTASGM